MSFTYRGKGYLALLLPLFVWVLSAVMFGHDAHVAQRVALLLTAVVVWYLGGKWNAEEGTDEDGSSHQLAGIPMQWYSLVIIGVVVLSLG